METLQQKSPRPGTGDFIKAHLRKVKEDYINNVHRKFCEFLKARGHRCCSYKSFRHYWYVCVKLGLLEFVREEPGKRPLPRRYYRLNPRKLQSKDWQNPQAALDLRRGRTFPDPVTGEPIPISKLGARRYRRWVKKEPPKPVGRPRKQSVA